MHNIFILKNFSLFIRVDISSIVRREVQHFCCEYGSLDLLLFRSFYEGQPINNRIENDLIDLN